MIKALRSPSPICRLRVKLHSDPAIVVTDERAAKWYERFGALALLDDPLKLILPLSIIPMQLSRPEHCGALELSFVLDSTGICLGP